MGQKQTFAVHKPMSALPPIADILDQMVSRYFGGCDLVRCWIGGGKMEDLFQRAGLFLLALIAAAFIVFAFVTGHTGSPF
jgi:hypothetical protein